MSTRRDLWISFVVALVGAGGAAGCGGGDGPSGGGDGGGGEADARPTPDAGPQADAGDCISLACGDAERCFDGVDNDCDGTVDEGCACTAGTTTRCLPSGTAPEASICSWGEMACVPEGEFGAWGPCVPPEGAGNASLYGCRRIGILGRAGQNPSSNFQAWLTTQGAIATRFHTDETAPALSIEELRTYDLVVVDWLSRTYSPGEAQTLATWVSEGGGLVTLTGHNGSTDQAQHNSLLATIGPQYVGSIISGPATLLAHPTTASAGGGEVLPPVTFSGGYEITSVGSFTPMAVIGDKVVGVAGPLGEGRVLIWGDEWIEFDSEWSSMPAIAQLWLNAVTWVSPSPGTPICEE